MLVEVSVHKFQSCILGHVVGIGARFSLRDIHFQAFEQFCPELWHIPVFVPETHRDSREDMGAVPAQETVVDEFRAVQQSI